MSATPLRLDIQEDVDPRPRDWRPRKIACKGPLRLVRLCVLGAFLPAALVAGPIYLRYRVYSEQLYPLAASDQRLIDRKVSTTWCQQRIHRDLSEVKFDVMQMSSGSWSEDKMSPSLIPGCIDHDHACSAAQRQVVNVNATFNAYLLKDSPKIERETKPISMTRHLVLEDDMKEYWGFYLLRGSSVTVSTCVRWPGASLTIIRGHKHLHECAFIGDDSSEELEELVQVAEEQGLLNGTAADFHLRLSKDSGPSNVPENMKRARQEVRFHEKSNAPRHPNGTLPSSGSTSFNYASHELDAHAMRQILTSLFVKTLDTKKKQKESPHHHYEGVFKERANIDPPPNFLEPAPKDLPDEHGSTGSGQSAESSTIRKTTDSAPSAKSAEVFGEVLAKLKSLGERGKAILEKLADEIHREDAEARLLKSMLSEAMTNTALSANDKKRLRRQLVLGSALHDLLIDEVAQEEDAAVEEEDLYPDGVAQDRGTVNETTLNDRSNSEFWSSFSSSEERLLECKGLILNLPLTPHRRCSPKFESEHAGASVANTVTYRVPTDGYYFFVFNSENEIQPNYVRIQFDLIKTMYDTSDPVHVCKNSTRECALPFDFFSEERTVLELPVTGNDSQWNEEYVVVSTCEPRTSVYLICIITVPLLILLFAFH